MEKKVKKSPYYQLSLSKSKHLISFKKIRFVQRDVRLQKHFKMFINISKNAKKCYPKRYESINIFKILDEVIPLEYFGTKYHKKLFYEVVKLILTQSRYECVYVKQLTMGCDLNQIPWLSAISQSDEKLGRRYLCDGHLWLLEKIVKPLIRRFYAVVKVGQLYELELVPKPLWSSFRQKVLNMLEDKRYLIPTDAKVKPRGFLQITPKDGYHNVNSFRLIVKLTVNNRCTRRKEKELARLIGRIIRHVASSLCSTKTTHLYKHWKEYLLGLNGRKMYGVKIDVQDAFGNVNLDFLCHILNTLQTQGKISIDVETILVQHITHQYVVCGKNKNGTPKIWKWNRGLCQGDRFSSALCQLYMSYLDAIHLNHLIQSTTFLHRTVDDYFFCSTEEFHVLEFIKVMESLHSLNRHKMQSNLTGFNHKMINYYGHTFSLETGQVKTFYNFKKRTEIRHKFKLWSIKKPIYNRHRTIATQKFLQSAMKFSSHRFYFQSTMLNTVINSEERVLENYFEAMVFLAFKVDASLMALKCIIKNFLVIARVIRKFVFKYANKAFKKILENKGSHSCGNLALPHFLKVGFTAFVLVLKKRKFYADNLILDYLKNWERKFNSKGFGLVGFEEFKKLPKVFDNISIQRRLPHHKRYVVSQ